MYAELADLAKAQNVEYRFDQTERNGMVRKLFYFGENLVGVGEDVSARQAKLKATVQGLDNIRNGQTVKLSFPKNGKLQTHANLFLGLMETLKQSLLLTETRNLTELVDEHELLIEESAQICEQRKAQEAEEA